MELQEIQAALCWHVLACESNPRLVKFVVGKSQRAVSTLCDAA
jgi:hypothetical protein